jgi:predicted phosphodiesterase
MSRLFITGDTHADFTRFSTKNFPLQKELTKEDYIIICGDFGLWHNCAKEQYWLDWLDKKNFTTIFVDGNHENFDRLNSNEFPIVDFLGAKAHQIRPSIYHILRGEVITIQGKTFFCFGGASSHDIQDGILDPETFVSKEAFTRVYKSYVAANKMFRVKGISWWPQELPSDEEMAHGLENLIAHNGEVDYIITHCLPQEVCTFIGGSLYKPDILTDYFNTIAQNVQFTKWFCGHYHLDQDIWGKFTILYDKIDEIRLEENCLEEEENYVLN